MKYASVRLDGMEIPFIGIPKDATEDKCDVCKQRFHFQDLTIVSDNSFLCPQCLKKIGGAE